MPGFRGATKASSTARGYGPDHIRARKQALTQLRDGDPCCRCRQPMYRSDDLHLDHNDTRTGYLGLSHSDCNRRAGARRGAQVANANRHGRPLRTIRRGWQSRNW